jgi:hypothetical protein
MRKLFFALAMLPALSLGSCANIPKDPETIAISVGNLSGAALEQLAPQFAEGIKEHCGFIVTAATWAGFTGVFASLDEAVVAACQYINRVKARVMARRRAAAGDGTFVINIRGGAVRGYFIR